MTRSREDRTQCAGMPDGRTPCDGRALDRVRYADRPEGQPWRDGPPDGRTPCDGRPVDRTRHGARSSDRTGPAGRPVDPTRHDGGPGGRNRCDACATSAGGPRAAGGPGAAHEPTRRPPARTAALLALALVLAAGAATGCGGRATTHHKPGTSHEQATGKVGTLLPAADAAGHKLREVPATGAPEVHLALRPDSEDGWNLQLAVKNFRFTPDSTGGAALPGAGHAHLELDGRKLARLYGPWFHLPAAQVPEGTHTLTVRLYADDHTAWAVSGRAVEGTAQLTAPAPARSEGGGHHHGDSPAPQPPTPGQEQADRTVTVTVRDGKVSPPPARTELRRGERVALRVTSDRADTLHVHGYDKEIALPAGQEATLVLTADRTGLFEVETHESNLVLTQLLVR
ncbi:hypothetical protein [Streptomyces sp. NRRL F-2664]|uniref:hypothetical protein n=1 Tax=Streptomyces sp. NRRL F-2664 TaxID=1463842 RepID=UPI000AEFF02D|nr:hypothetical protein [Streptomyces sp. NRRL F-2664]